MSSKKISKTDQVYQFLLENVLNGRFYPGQILIERELVNQLGVSKTPIREALMRFKQEGLAEGDTHRNVTIIRITRKDIEEIYSLREVLEGLAASDASRNIDAKSAQRLRSVIQISEKYLERQDLDKYANIDLKFHNLLAELSGNNRMVDILRNLRAQTRIMIKTSIKLFNRGGRISLREHKEITEAVCQGDPIKSELKAKEHVRKAKTAIFSWFEVTT